MRVHRRRTGVQTCLLLLAVAGLAVSCGSEDGVPGQDTAAGGAGATGAGTTTTTPDDDSDDDGVVDDDDNCIDVPNPSQADTDQDDEGDACEFQDGTREFPFIIPGDPALPDYRDARDTQDATSSLIDQYPGFEDLDESGPEFYYITRLEQVTHVDAWLKQPEPDGTDVDIHLLSEIDPPTVVERGNHELGALLDPGLYHLTVDTFASDGTPQSGPYDLSVALEGWHAGTVDDPLLPGDHPTDPLQLPVVYHDSRDTTDASSAAVDAYPGFESIDESGPEYIYRFTLAEAARLSATIAFAEPSGTDIDLHLLSALEPITLVERGDNALYALLEPGTYFLIADTYASAGEPRVGPYDLRLAIRSRTLSDETYFNDPVLAAIDYLWASYRMLGYDSAVLTHDVPYGSSGVIEASGGARTMCVAAAMEIILAAMNIWAEDRGDDSVFDFLPESSWETLHVDHIKAHIWVNHSLDSYGTADALAHFGMGEPLPLEQLTPGAFINLNRTTGTGHAVVFVSFIDIAGHEYPRYEPGMVGFKYFSSQGGYDVGSGGMDFRYAIFEQYGSPPMPGKRDLHVVESDNDHLLNTGMMWAPPRWTSMDYQPPAGAWPSAFDPVRFDGRTADD
jgi:hypothetical protein